MEQQSSELTGWDFETRPGGWIRLKGDGLTAYLRFAVTATAGPSRFDLKEAVVQAGDGEVLSGRTWRRLPVATLEALLGVAASHAAADPPVPLTHQAKEALAAFTSELPTDPVGCLEQHFENTAATGLDFQEIDDASTGGAVWVQAKDGQRTGVSYASGGATVGAPPQIVVPKRLTDDFLKEVAAAYRWFTQEGKAPAPAIAEIADVPPRRVHRWVADARKRGFLPPARPGRAG